MIKFLLYHHKQLLNHLLAIVEKKHGFGKLASVLEEKNDEGQGLLHLAVLGSHLSMAKMLLERGCNVESVMDGEESVLHICAVSGLVEMTELILKFMPIGGIDRANEKGRTALHKSAKFGKHKIVSMLLKRFVCLFLQSCFSSLSSSFYNFMDPSIYVAKAIKLLSLKEKEVPSLFH